MLLREHRATLVRTKRHLVYKFPDGKTFVQACTPSDVHALDNQLRDLKRLLGINGDRGTPGERRERKIRPGRAANGKVITPSANTAMLDALRNVGLAEDLWKSKLATAAIELRASRQANHRKKVQLRSMTAHCKECWGCGLSRWWRRMMRR